MAAIFPQAPGKPDETNWLPGYRPWIFPPRIERPRRGPQRSERRLLICPLFLSSGSVRSTALFRAFCRPFRRLGGFLVVFVLLRLHDRPAFCRFFLPTPLSGATA